VIAGVLILLVIAAGATNAPVEISLNKLAIVDQDTVTLGDVATIDDPDPAVVNALAALELTAAPRPAHAMVIQKKDMELLLLRQGLDRRHVTLVGPDTIPVVREGQILEADHILGAVRDYIRTESGWKAEDFTMECPWEIEEVCLPSGPYEIHVESLSRSLSETPRFRVAVNQGNKEVGTLTVSVRVSRFIDAFMARRDIARGENLSIEDFEPTRLDQNRLSSRQMGNLIRDAKLVEGKEARFAIPAGRPLTADIFQAPTVIERGERVIIELVNGSVRVTGPGVARQSGKMGQILQVQNQVTGKYMYARVTAPGTVTID
jgi:flagella basal body P-ring formation protein FlgA